MDLYFFKILLRLAKVSPWHLPSQMRALRCDRLFVVRKPSRRKKKAQKNPNKIVLIFVLVVSKQIPVLFEPLDDFFGFLVIFKMPAKGRLRRPYIQLPTAVARKKK